MTTPDYRALCAELTDELEDWIHDGDESDIDNAHALIDRARAALAEPEPLADGEVGSDEELLKTYCDARRAFYFEAAEGESDQEDRKAATIAGLHAVLALRARAALAEPEPPAAGEVAELVDSLGCEARNEEVYGNCAVITATELRRAADLLERLALQPVPEGPTNKELHQLWRDLYAFHDGPTSGDVAEIARAVLARWGT
jgi:hypothetical protein